MKDTQAAEDYLKKFKVPELILKIWCEDGAGGYIHIELSQILTDFAASEIDRGLPSEDKINEQAMWHSLDKEVTPVNFIENFYDGANWVIKKLKEPK